MPTTTQCMASGRLSSHERADGGLLRSAREQDQTHPIPCLQIERSVLGGAEERGSGAPWGGLRMVGLEAARLHGELFAALRLFTNLFLPLYKLNSSVREGDRITAAPPSANAVAAAFGHRSGEQKAGHGPAGAAAEQRSDVPIGGDPPPPGAAGLAGQR